MRVAVGTGVAVGGGLVGEGGGGGVDVSGIGDGVVVQVGVGVGRIGVLVAVSVGLGAGVLLGGISWVRVGTGLVSLATISGDGTIRRAVWVCVAAGDGFAATLQPAAKPNTVPRAITIERHLPRHNIFQPLC